MKLVTMLLLGTALATATLAAEAATLKPEAVVIDDRVRVADLFDDPGPQAGQIVAHAPAPGRQTVFDAIFLNRVARAYQVNWRASSSLDQIQVSRASQVIGPGRIREALTQALARKIPAGRIDIGLDNRWLELHVPVGQDAVLAVENLNYVPYQYRFSADLVVPSDGPMPQRVIVTGRAVGMVNAPVMLRRVNPGDPITAGDIGWIETPFEFNDGDLVTSAEQLIGQTPRHYLAINAPLRARDLEAPRLVAKGAIVTMVLQTPTMVLTAQGRALQAGARGEVVRVVNTQSNRTVDATVTGTNQVAIARPGIVIN